MASNSELDQILALAARSSSPGAASNGNGNGNGNGHSSPVSNAITSASSGAYSSFQYDCSTDNPNKCQPHELAPALPLDQYRLNEDSNPEVVRKKPLERVNYTQNVAVRYLKPPAPAPAGDIVIKQLPDRQVAPAPPLHVTQQQPSRPNPAPLVIREAPPPPPAPVPGQFHQIPGKILPPPARKVVTEFLPPCPPKPQQIIIDRWLPYEQPQQKVIYQPAKPPCLIPDPRNVHIIWAEPDVCVTQCFVNLGVHETNPADYCARYGSSLIQADQLPEVAVQFGSRGGHSLAATHRQSVQPVLYGDVEYLRLIQQQQQQQC